VVLFAGQSVSSICKLNLPLSRSKALSQQVGGVVEYGRVLTFLNGEDGDGSGAEKLKASC
jgi:hypothetical protein